MITEPPRHSVSVAAAVIHDDGRVLAIRRRDNGHWEPPGGILELDETIEHGLTREVKEETGLTVKIDRLSGVYKNMPRGIVALVFRCHITGGTAQPTPEVTEVAWLTSDEVHERMSEAFAVRLLDAIGAATHGPAVRTHDGENLVSSVTL